MSSEPLIEFLTDSGPPAPDSIDRVPAQIRDKWAAMTNLVEAVVESSPETFGLESYATDVRPGGRLTVSLTVTQDLGKVLEYIDRSRESIDESRDANRDRHHETMNDLTDRLKWWMLALAEAKPSSPEDEEE